MGFYLGKSRGGGTHRYLVLCYDLASGKELWRREVHAGEPRKIHLKNSYASATPVTDGQRVVALFHDVGLFAFDHDGQRSGKCQSPRVAQTATLATALRLHFTMAGCIWWMTMRRNPLPPPMTPRRERNCGALKRKPETNYSTPFVWTGPQPAQLIVPATKRTVAYDLTGKEVWSFTGGMSEATICTPFAANGLLYVASGLVSSPVRGLFVIKPGAHGDITLRDGATSNEAIAWSNPKIAPYNTTPLVFGDELYILYDRGMLSCFDLRTGKPH